MTSQTLPEEKPNHSAVSLRIFGDALDPDQITPLMKCSPNTCHRKGDLIKNRDGVPYWNDHTSCYSMRKSGMWSIKAPMSEPADVEGQMHSLLAQLPTDLAVWSNITQNLGLRIEFFCGFFMYRSNEGLVLSSEILKMMTDRHIELGLAIYSSSEEELRERREAFAHQI